MMLGRYAWVLALGLYLAVAPAALFAADLPAGFSETLIASGLDNPTAMAIASDGRIFVCQQTGELRVIRDRTLLSPPFLTVGVNSDGERGLLGVAIDPNFAVNPYVYVYYTTAEAPIHNRVSRFTASGDVAAAGSEVVLLELDTLSGATNHNGGGLHFGVDGMLYVAAGENANPSNSQTLDNLLGKMLRIRSDGTIPEDNPFYEIAVGKNRAIWALGLRNPFTFAVQPGSGRLFINDVGQNAWEEINVGVAAGNYGWPYCEGPCGSSFAEPFHFYPNGGGTCAIVGAAFYNPTLAWFPADYLGDYFFADLCAGWIRRIDLTDRTVSDFAAGIPAPVDLAVTPDGALYYLARGAGGVLYRVEFAAAVSTAVDVAVDANSRRYVLHTDPAGRAILSTIDASGAQESRVSFGPFSGWMPRAIAAAPDGRTRLLWTHDDGQVSVWFLSASGVLETGFAAGPFNGWTAMDVSVGPDDRTRLLWAEAGGAAAVYILSADGTYESNSLFGPFAGWTARRLDLGYDNRTRLLWSDTTGTTSVWFLDASGAAESSVAYGPFNGWTPIDIGVGADGKARLLWHHASGASAVWLVSNAGEFQSGISYGPYPGWAVRALDVASDNRASLLWAESTGWTSLWQLSSSAEYEIGFNFPPESH
jgi:glucose/arabinose dehydrogenase